jgi:hypothetical protein
LDIADYCFKKESSEENSATTAAKKKKKNEAVKEDERSQYLAAALRFDPHEYFRRLICHQTVRLYLRALELYASNSPQVNHHIFVFLQVSPPAPHLSPAFPTLTVSRGCALIGSKMTTLSSKPMQQISNQDK